MVSPVLRSPSAFLPLDFFVGECHIYVPSITGNKFALSPFNCLLVQLCSIGSYTRIFFGLYRITGGLFFSQPIGFYLAGVFALVNDDF